MARGTQGKIGALERKLQREFNAEAIFPDGVPAELRLTLLTQACEEVRAELRDPEYVEMRRLFGKVRTTIDFCGGWCPGCAILEWCETARELYPAQARAWMKEHNDYLTEEER